MTTPVGRWLGYDIIVGDDVPAGAYQTWELPGGLSIATEASERALGHLLRPFTLDSIVGLTGQLTAARLWRAREFAEAISLPGVDPRITFSPFLLRRLLREAIVSRELPDESRRVIRPSQLMTAERALFEQIAPADRSALTDSQVESLFLRLIQAQYQDQLGLLQYKMELSRTLATIEEAQKMNLDLAAVYRSAYGLTYEEMVFLALVLCATLASHPRALFDPAIVDLQEMAISGDVVRSFWDHCAITYREFACQAQSDRVTIPGYELYGLSPTVKWPLMITDSGPTLAPIAGDLLHRANRGFVIDSLQAIGDDSTGRGRFNVARGRAFEAYVGRTLHAMIGAGDVSHADKMFDGGHCDWVCQEERRVTLVEAKTIWFDLGSEMTKERDRLKRELSKGGSIVDAVQQLDASAQAIRRGETPIPKSTNLMGLIVVGGHEVGLNAQMMNEIVLEVLEERGAPQPIIKYQVANDEGFAYLARRFRNGGSLCEFLYRKHKSPAIRQNELHLADNTGSEDLPAHPLEAEHDLRFLEVIGRFSEPLAEHFLERRAP